MNEIEKILARQKKDVLEGRDPVYTLEYFRAIRAELLAEGLVPKPIKKLKANTKWFYSDNPAALVEFLNPLA